MGGVQRSLFGREVQIGFDHTFGTLVRRPLDESSWIEHGPGFLTGHENLLDTLVTTTRWQEHQRQMYDHIVDVPRLTAALPDHGSGHPILNQIRGALEARYACAFPHVTLAYYRNGNDSVAFHGDYVAREMPDALVATLSVGAPRKFLLRPKTGGASVTLSLGWGDLLIMGGACQRTWEHAIPKVKAAGPRVAIMFRPSWYGRAPRWSLRGQQDRADSE